jgi:Na+/H+ antiporter NhaD/arsenite permease-like protein
MNFVTAPLIADLFLLAILAIGRQEVHDGTIGAQNISPVDIMAFFLTLAYIAISIDASGLLRYLAFKVLQKGGQNGHRLYFYLYSFFFCLGSFIGNDPIILSGTAFLAYMTRVSADIEHPRAWIFAQFTVANIASAILVSSNPTNLVLAGAFKIKFIKYSANMIIPAVVTAVILFPCLLHIRFADPPSLIPESIGMRPLPDEVKLKKPRNPNIPLPRGSAEEEENLVNDDKGLEEILHPFLDGRSATFGAVIMAATLIAILVLNAVSQGTGEHPVFWVTLPAAFIMFCWDLMFGWCNRHETRKIARGGRGEVELPRAEWAIRKEEEKHEEEDERKGGEKIEEVKGKKEASKSLESLVADAYRWLQETFPTVMTVFAHLPYAVVPFALSMFVLVQGLVTKGWVPVFAHGWDHWVDKTGTIGSIGGMGFLSVILCNVSSKHL